MIKFIVLLLLSAYNANCQTLNENTYFVNTAELSGVNYKLDWNYTDTDVIFRATVRTSGWVGFGLSPNGGMKNSDLILAWTNTNGIAQFRDAHTENALNPLYDTVQNWQRLFYSLKNGVTTVIFKRSIKVCNPDQPVNEININVEPTQYVIFAWSNTFDNNLPTYHGSSRGSKFLPLLGSLNKQITLNMNQVETIDFRINVKQLQVFCFLNFSKLFISIFLRRQLKLNKRNIFVLCIAYLMIS